MPLYGDGRSGTTSFLPGVYGGYQRAFDPLPPVPPGPLSRQVGPPSTIPMLWALGNDGSSANVTTMPIVIPAAAAVGDVVVVCASVNSNLITVTPPVGWNALSGLDPATTSQGSYLFTHTLTAGEPGSTATFTSSAGCRLIGVLVVVPGASEAGIVSVVLADLASDATTTSPGLTTGANPAGYGVIDFYALRTVATTAALVTVSPADQRHLGESRTVVSGGPNWTIAAFMVPPAMGPSVVYPAGSVTTSASTVGNSYSVAVPLGVGAPLQQAALDMSAVASVEIGGTWEQQATLDVSAVGGVGVTSTISTAQSAILSVSATTSASIAGTWTQAGAVNVSAAGSLTDTGTQTKFVALSASATTSTSIAGTWTQAGAVNVSAAGTAAWGGILVGHTPLLDVAGVGSAVIGATRGPVATLALTATATVLIDYSIFRPAKFGPIDVTAVCSVVIGGTWERPAVLAVTAAGSLTDTGTQTKFVALSASATTSASISGTWTQAGAVSVSAAGTAAWGGTLVGHTPLLATSAVGSITLGALRTQNAVLALTAIGSITLGALWTQNAVLAVTASASVSITSGASATLTLTAVTSLADTGVRTQIATLTLTAVPSLVVAGTQTRFATLTLTAVPSLVVAGTQTRFSTLSLTALASLAVTGTISVLYFPYWPVAALLITGQPVLGAIVPAPADAVLVSFAVTMAVLTVVPVDATVIPAPVDATTVPSPADATLLAEVLATAGIDS